MCLSGSKSALLSREMLFLVILSDGIVETGVAELEEVEEFFIFGDFRESWFWCLADDDVVIVRFGVFWQVFMLFMGSCWPYWGMSC